MSEGTLAPVGLALLQAVVVLAACRACAALARRAGQPEVIGEIAGGLLLGPAVLGAAAPRAWAALFPPGGLGPLTALSQAGILLFLFAVGLELDFESLRARARAAALVSAASVAVPFALGLAIAPALFARWTPPHADSAAFALFLGVAMSVTAFPVLARILREAGLEGTPLGAAALACAALDDAAAWCGLAAAAGLARGGGLAAGARVAALVAGYAALMLFAVRPLLARWFSARLSRGVSGKELAAAALGVMLASAWATDAIGIHALFGAFAAGVAMPARAELRRSFVRRFEELTSLALLPLFFALTGLRARPDLLGGAGDWGAFALILGAAFLGKLGAGAIAARVSGLRWREALSLGALMNSRGLVELVVLNVGYELGVLPPAAFTSMVLMALVTTAATGPLLRLFRTADLREAAPRRAAGAGV